MDPEAGNPPPSGNDRQIESRPDNLKPSNTPEPTPLENPLSNPPVDRSGEISRARETIAKAAQAQDQERTGPESKQARESNNQGTPNIPRSNNSIIGDNPYPHIPPLRGEAADNTPIVAGQDFKPEEFSSQDYLHGKGLGSNYGLLKNGYDAYDNNRFWNPVVRAATKYVRAVGNARALDVGCAAGYFVKRLQQAGFAEVIGIDISPTSLEEAKRHTPAARFEELNLNSDRFNETLEGTFDLVTAFDVLEHTAHRTSPDGREISGPEHVVPKLVPLLKPGGILIMSMPVTDRNPVSWFFNLFDSDKSHVSKLPSTQILEIVKANGLDVLEKHYSFLLPWLRIPFLPTALEVICRKQGQVDPKQHT